MSNYPEKYGAWAGNPAGFKPDYTRCCESVWPNERGAIPHQCNRKRGHGPNGDYCKQHDPATVKARADESRASYLEKINKERYGWYGKKFYNVLKQIAEGHNDARGLAQGTISEFEAGAYK